MSACQKGMFAALEKAYVAMAVAAFTGFHPEIGLGHLESGLTLSPVQLLIEREMTDAVRFLQHRAVDEAGLRPVIEIMYVDFTTCCMDPLVNQAARSVLCRAGPFNWR